MTIDVYADIACPWCYVGHARLKAALAERDDLSPVIHWRPFQLQPDMPKDGREWRAVAEEKFGGWDRAQKMFERVREAAEMEGLPVDFDAMTTAPNTEDAHRLVLWTESQSAGDGAGDEAGDGTGDEAAHAPGESSGERMADQLYRAYFAEGVNVSDREALVAQAERAGFDAEAAREMLAGDAFVEAVADSQEQAERFNIRGVPCYVFGERYALSGAQPPGKIHRAIDAAQGANREG